MRPRPKRKVRLLMLCYAAALLAWVLWGTVALVRANILRGNGSMPARPLQWAEAETATGLIETEGWDAESLWLLSFDNDPQVVWHLAGTRVQRLVFDATAVNSPAGEMVLYYTTRPDEPFSERNKLWAQQDGEGRYYFDLGGRRIERLRLDPDAAGGIIWQVRGITLNAAKPAFAYYRPDTLQMVALLLMPVLAWAFIGEAWAFVQPTLVKRRFESRWKQA